MFSKGGANQVQPLAGAGACAVAWGCARLPHVAPQQGSPVAGLNVQQQQQQQLHLCVLYFGRGVV